MQLGKLIKSGAPKAKKDSIDLMGQGHVELLTPFGEPVQRALVSDVHSKKKVTFIFKALPEHTTAPETIQIMKFQCSCGRSKPKSPCVHVLAFAGMFLLAYTR